MSQSHCPKIFRYAIIDSDVVFRLLIVLTIFVIAQILSLKIKMKERQWADGSFENYHD